MGGSGLFYLVDTFLGISYHLPFELGDFTKFIPTEKI